MSRVYLPIGEKAHTPFILRPMATEVSCIEEICFYILREADLLEKEFMSEELIGFIATELCLDELADKLYLSLDQDHSLLEFCRIILKYVGFVSQGELLSIEEKLQISENSSETDKMMKKLTHLTRQKEYHSLISQCKNLRWRLSQNQQTEQIREMTGMLYCKEATAYARLFYYQPAAELFLKAKEVYEECGLIMESKEAAQQYLLCLYLMWKGDRFHSFVEAHPEFLELSMMAEQQYNKAIREVDELFAEQGTVSQRQQEMLRRDFERM